ncbi:MAG: hypothetical protein IKO84_11505 [Butyrivibrio sp.]|nr:hypothetical protein [Butyrivibrio sp.]
MELKKVTCPNCGSSEIKKINDEQYKCSYCDAIFLIDYDKEDAEVIINKSKNSTPKLIAMFLFVIIVVIIALSLFIRIRETGQSSSTTTQSEQASSKKPQLRLLDAKDIEAGTDLSEFTKAADSCAKNMKESYTGSWTRVGDPKLVGEYLLNSEDDNMLWFFYEFSWEKEDGETDERYVAINFKNIRMTEDNKIKSNYSPDWDFHMEYLGNYPVYGYTDLDTAYRESITALPEYTVTEIDL